MRIRLATPSDLAAVAQIYEDIHTREESGKQTTGWIRDVYPTRQTAQAALSRGDLFVLEEDPDLNFRICGAAMINRIQVDVYATAPWEYETDEVCVLHTLVISPKASGKGYGEAFVRFYEEWAANHGIYELRMDTNARNQKARALYQALGYKEIAIVPTVFNGIPDVKLVLLEKRLDPRSF